jgi:hypothetical protein
MRFADTIKPMHKARKVAFGCFLPLRQASISSSCALAIWLLAVFAAPATYAQVPAITNQPSNVTESATYGATFTVGATGAGPLFYQWSFDGTNISGATNATLALTNLSLSQSGSYTVIVTNASGSVTNSSPALLNVAAPYAFTTLAGLAGTSGNADGAGNIARFNSPLGVALDSAGNVYVSDPGNQQLRKITPAGMVSTIPFFFDDPGGIAVDGAGNIYVADFNYDTIYKMTSAGVVTVLAGQTIDPGYADGTGSTAQFHTPLGLALDSAGNIYVADRDNEAIRKVTPAGEVSTLAGGNGAGSADGTGTAAHFYSPYGVAVDSMGNVYVADAANNTIRKVTSAGVVTTLAGRAGNPGSSDGMGVAAQFNAPSGVAVDANGNIFVADQFNSAIREVTPVGLVTTLSGLAGTTNGTDGIGSLARFNHPAYVALDSAGSLYVADDYNDTIRKGVPNNSLNRDQLVVGEYFWDTDPGLGLGTSVSIPTGETLIPSDIPPLNVNVTALTAGLHKLGFRVEDAEGRWSDISWLPIQVQDPNALLAAVTNWSVGDSNKLLASAEYFWGADPGLGSGSTVAVPQTETLIPSDLAPINVNVSQLAAGTHQLSFRVKDVSGRWSSSAVVPVQVEDPAALIATVTNWSIGDSNKLLVAGEYFWDTDPGQGHGTGIAVSPGETWVADTNALVTASIPALADGIHRLGSRVEDAGGRWSDPAWLPILMSDPPVITNQPRSQIVAVTSNASFTVGVGGAAPFLFQWYQNGTNLPGATNQTLAFSSAQFTNAGTYSVDITNIYGMATSQTATLTVSLGSPVASSVLGGGTISMLPNSGAYTLGQPVTLTATPGRYNTFLGWSDGNTSASRTITIGTSNYFTAIFTNTEPLDTQFLKRWEADFGGTDYEEARGLQPTSDGGYVLAGISRSGVNGSKTATNYGAGDFWLVKVDSHGIEQWERTYGGSGDDYLYAIIPTSDGGFLMGGSTTSGVSGNKTTPTYGGLDGWLVKVDASGNKQWEQTYGGSGDDYFLALQQTSDGGYIATGASSSPPSASSTSPIGNKTSPTYGGQDAWVLKLDASGNKQWEQSYGGSADDFCPHVFQTADGGFLLGAGSWSGVSGTKTAPNDGMADVWLIKVDGSGNEQWEQTYGRAGSDYDSSVFRTPDGGIIVGSILNYTSGDYWLMKLDGNGNVQWQQTYDGGGQDLLSAVAPTSDGGYLLGGYSTSGAAGAKSSPNFGGFDYWILKVDALGNKICDVSYGGSAEDDLLAMAVDRQQNVLLSGWSASSISGNKTTLNFGSSDMWAVAASVRTAPIGTPVVLVNGLYDPSNNFAIPATNAILVTLQSTFANGYIFYTLDGNAPSPGADDTSQYLGPGMAGAPFTVTNSVVVTAVAFSSDATGNMEADADPVVVSVVPLYGLSNSTPGGGGVSFAPPGGTYLSNAVVTVTAAPSNGWTFMRWEGTVTNSSNPLTLSMNGSNNVRAVFGTTLATNGSANGSIAVSVANTSYPFGPYPYGSIVRLTGLPVAGKVFTRWQSAISGPTSNPLDFLVVSNGAIITANFTTLAGGSFTLETPPVGYGTVTRNPSANSYASGTGVSLTAVPDVGYTFSAWGGDAGGSQNPLNVTMNANKVITATFVSTSTQAYLPPVVAVASPSAGAMFTAPVNIPVTASGSDPNTGGTINQVAFFADATLLGVTSNAAFNVTWNNAPVGSHALTAVATDNFGMSATSSPVSIVVQTALPVIALAQPTNGTVFVSPTNVFIQAAASDADNSIAHVDFYADAGFLASVTNPPYQITWTNPPVGSHALAARAVDSYGPIVTSSVVNVTVSAPAAFAFSSAGYSANEADGSVSVTVINSGNIGGVVNYQTSDGTALGGTGISGDYVSTAGSLTFANGQHSSNIVISLLDNYLAGPDIQFSVQLSSAGAGAVSSPSTTVVTIHENDSGAATNSLLVHPAPSAQPPANGQLMVVLNPPQAGGQWRFPWDLAWRNSGDPVSGLVAGNYPVEFRAVPNWLPYPTTASAVVSSGTTYLTNQHLPTLTPSDAGSVGSLTVNIGGLTGQQGAGWRFLGETSWRGPGSTASSLLPDTYFMEFEPVSSYSKPANLAVSIFGGENSTITESYSLAASLPGGVTAPQAISPASSIPDVSHFPYGFNGQLQTDAGFGSGVAVRETVVLTAAHMVFNDQTLAFVQNAWWSFQQETSSFAPEPLAARGWYVLSGYSSQRITDLTNGFGPDESSPSSRDLDVAALYFNSPAARAGYGGYLSSDAAPNPYLTNPSVEKMVVGYPVDGSQFGQIVTPGMMYAAPQGGETQVFSQANDQVYTASWLLSYPGNSGGPVYVQYQNGYFYPAAVYLGTLNNNTTVVRAIDSGVVNMINLAARLGDAGTNYLGGGVITIIPLLLVSPTHPAFVQVVINPPAAVAAGAGWRVHGDPSYGSQSNYTRLIESTNATIEFASVPGWILPTNQSIGVSPGVLTTITNVLYTVVPPNLVPTLYGLGMSGTTNTPFRIESRTSLGSGNWAPFHTNTLNSPGFNMLITNPPPGFYRAVWLTN